MAHLIAIHVANFEMVIACHSLHCKHVKHGNLVRGIDKVNSGELHEYWWCHWQPDGWRDGVLENLWPVYKTKTSIVSLLLHEQAINCVIFCFYSFEIGHICPLPGN